MAGRILVLLALAASAARADGPVAFVDVRVVPMDEERVREHRTVLVRDGRIAAILPATAPVPQDHARVEGGGRWLVPGLCDMHVHHWYEEERVLFLASGVTTVRNMWGTPQHLRAPGNEPGPRVVTTGPILDGPEPVWQGSVVLRTPAEARAEVLRQARAGYDAVKLYNRLAPEVVEAIVGAARDAGMRVEGHVPWAVGIDRMLALRPDSIEHLEGYFRYTLAFDAERMGTLARATVEAGVWNCPTLIVYRRFVPAEEAGELLARPEMRFVPPRLRATWDPARDFRLQSMSPEQFEAVRRGDRVRMRIVKALFDAGAPMLAGTDCGNPFVAAGFSLHDELACLVEAGLTPFEALRCATALPARYLGLDEEAGTVAEGGRADLVLLEGDPLEDIANTRRIAGVMRAGRWLPRAELDRMLEEVAASYGRPVERFRGRPALPPGTSSRFEVSWNGLVVGEERFCVATGEDGLQTVVVQQVNDPPAGTFRSAGIALARDGGLASLRLGREDAHGVGERRWEAADLPTEGVATSGFLADWWILRRRLEGLARGEEWTFTRREPPEDAAMAWRSARVTVRREVGEGDRRVYALRFEEDDAVVEGRLIADEEGWPVEVSTTLQQGVVRFARVAD